MSAVVCGKRSLFEDQLHTSPPVSKRLRCSAGGGTTSPILFSPTRATPLSHLRTLFPGMDDQLLERALENCGNDLDSTIKSLNDLYLRSTERNLGSPAGKYDARTGASVELSSEVVASPCEPQINNIFKKWASVVNNSRDILEGPSPPVNNLPVDGAEWVELFVREMMNASDADDARDRAARGLEVLEKSIMPVASAVVAQNLHKENLILKEQVDVLIRDNIILKRAVTIQHERQKEHNERNHELQHLKQLVSQYQEQLRTLEVNNYALIMHLRQAQQGNSIPSRFHPDVF